MNARKQPLINSVLVACCLAAVSVIGYPQRPQEDRAGKTQVAKSERGSQEDKRGDEERQASIQKVAQQQKVVRDAYVRLMRYHTAARDEQAATSDVSYKPEDYVVFELRDMHTGPVEEISDRPLEELVTAGEGEMLKVTPHHLQFGNGPKHAYYDVEWGSNSSSAQYNESLTIGRFLRNAGDSLAEVDRYTGYEVTARLAGKVRTYRAIALHYSQLDSSGKGKTEIFDNITPEMNTVLADESPRVRSPWKTYIKSGLYLAVARQISKKEKTGKPLIPADAPIGYLPGDDVIPDANSKGAMTMAAVCPSQMTTDDVVVIAWVNANAIDLPSRASLTLIGALNLTETCVPLVASWALGATEGLGSDADRAYANAFLVKNSGNAEPPNSSINPIAIQLGGDFRLFNRFQVRFSVSNGLITDPQYIQFVSQVGSTPNPCTRFLPSLSGEAHPSNGASGVVFGRTVYQLTEGRIGSAGQAVSETINGRKVPWIWSVIKFDKSGFPDATDHAVFPTYYVYKNGQLIQIFPQGALSTFVLKDDTYQRQPWEIQ